MATEHTLAGLSVTDAFVKRTFDILVSATGLMFTWWIIVLAAIAATLDTRKNGFFLQQRVGRNAKLFTVIKIRTMRQVQGVDTTVTTANDARITALGRILRKTKIDELPQLINVLFGQMSFVGPRPDVPSFADKLAGNDRLMLTIRPGITGPATLKYRDEETLLAAQADPTQYNLEVIWPDKVRLNCEYVLHWRFWMDLEMIWCTVSGKRFDA
ncbi:MAG: sugar transferase [Gallionella sp.]|nr:sugar transferase [Gallionella sp.]